MAISSLHPEMPADELHAIAVGFNSVNEANIILQHTNCSKATRQMVVAKLYLFDDKELRSIPEYYHDDIHAVAQQKLGDPTVTATG